MKTALVSAAVAAAVLISGAVAGAAGKPAPAGDKAHGKTLYAANCAACHGAGGEGGVGPSLKGEGKRRTAAWVTNQIKNPQPPMPKLFPQTLSEKDVADLTAFVRAW